MEPGVFIQDRFLPLREPLQGAGGLRPYVPLLELGGAVAQGVGAHVRLLGPLPALSLSECLLISFQVQVSKLRITMVLPSGCGVWHTLSYHECPLLLRSSLLTCSNCGGHVPGPPHGARQERGCRLGWHVCRSEKSMVEGDSPPAY